MADCPLVPHDGRWYCPICERELPIRARRNCLGSDPPRLLRLLAGERSIDHDQAEIDRRVEICAACPHFVRAEIACLTTLPANCGCTATQRLVKRLASGECQRWAMPSQREDGGAEAARAIHEAGGWPAD